MCKDAKLSCRGNITDPVGYVRRTETLVAARDAGRLERENLIVQSPVQTSSRGGVAMRAPDQHRPVLVSALVLLVFAVKLQGQTPHQPKVSPGPDEPD